MVVMKKIRNPSLSWHPLNQKIRKTQLDAALAPAELLADGCLRNGNIKAQRDES